MTHTRHRPVRRVLLTVPDLDPTASPWREAMGLARYLPSDRFDLTVCSLRPEGVAESTPLLESLGAKCFVARFRPRGAKLSRLADSLRDSRRVKAHGPFDIQHSMDFSSSPFEAWMSRRYSRVFLFNQRNMNEDGHPTLLKLKAKAAQRVICLSEAVMHLMRGLAAPSKLVKIHPGIETERIAFQPPCPNLNGTFKLLMVGHVVRRKRLEDGIATAAELAREMPGLQLEIAGKVVDPFYLDELKDLIRARGLDERVKFLGPLSGIFELMGQADALLHTAGSEAFGMVLIEAMAAGLPVVAPALDGAREIIEHGRSGLLVSPADTRHYAEAVRRLVRDPEFRHQLASGARRRVETHFSARRMAEEIAAVYESLITRTATTATSSPRPSPPREERGRQPEGVGFLSTEVTTPPDLSPEDPRLLTSSPTGKRAPTGRPAQTRVVLVVPSFPKLSETFIVSKFLGLLERGWDVYLVCTASEPGQWENFPNLLNHPEASRRVKKDWPHRPRWLAALLLPGALLRCLWQNPAGTFHYLGQGARQFGLGVLRQFYLDAAIVALKPDLVHFEFGALAVGRMHLKQLLGCKVVASFRGYDLNISGLENPDYFREVWEQTDALHLLGADLWRRALRRGCAPGKPHVLIPPAIDAQHFDPAKLAPAETDTSPGQKVRILSVGRLEWKKGYEHAIQAVHLLRKMGVACEYHILGGGSFVEPLAFARHQLGLDDEVHLRGAVRPVDVRQCMRNSDIFLHTAISEGFCNAVLEAQAMSLPVVCTDADGLPENVAGGETGFVAPRRDANALAEKLRILALSPSLRTRMGQAGRQRVLARFQLADQLQAFDRFYRGVLSGEPPA